MRAFVRNNSLSIFFLTLFLLALGFQSLAGWQDFNNAQLRHDGEAIGYGRYLLSSEFGVAMLENWQSEYLQFALYITDAKVDLDGGDSVFLEETPAGWRVTAAGCKPVPDQEAPYDCEIES